jgi:hypothetical protein
VHSDAKLGSKEKDVEKRSEDALSGRKKSKSRERERTPTKHREREIVPTKTILAAKTREGTKIRAKQVNVSTELSEKIDQVVSDLTTAEVGLASAGGVPATADDSALASARLELPEKPLSPVKEQEEGLGHYKQRSMSRGARPSALRKSFTTSERTIFRSPSGTRTRSPRRKDSGLRVDEKNELKLLIPSSYHKDSLTTQRELDSVRAHFGDSSVGELRTRTTSPSMRKETDLDSLANTLRVSLPSGAPPARSLLHGERLRSPNTYTASASVQPADALDTVIHQHKVAATLGSTRRHVSTPIKGGKLALDPRPTTPGVAAATQRLRSQSRNSASGTRAIHSRSGKNDRQLQLLSRSSSLSSRAIDRPR